MSLENAAKAVARLDELVADAVQAKVSDQRAVIGIINTLEVEGLLEGVATHLRTIAIKNAVAAVITPDGFVALGREVSRDQR